MDQPIDLQSRLEFSVIIPVYNEEGAVSALAGEIVSVLAGRSYEMIFVDDGSTDATRETLMSLKASCPGLRILSHRQNAGQSRAIRTGVEAARGRIIGILDGDGQNDPADLVTLYRHLTGPNAPLDLGLVIGERMQRKDGFRKRVASHLANALRRAVLKDANQDSGCGLKVLSRALFLRLPYFDHMHRFMPALVKAEGHSVEKISVYHRQREKGQSKYNNIGRAVFGLKDLCGVAWLMKRRRPYGGVDEL